MNFKEKRLRDRGRMIEKSYAFWNRELDHRVPALEVGEDYETPEEYHRQLKAEEELKYILCHLNFESKEMEKLERDIIAFEEQDEV